MSKTIKLELTIDEFEVLTIATALHESICKQVVDSYGSQGRFESSVIDNLREATALRLAVMKVWTKHNKQIDGEDNDS